MAQEVTEVEIQRRRMAIQCTRYPLEESGINIFSLKVVKELQNRDNQVLTPETRHALELRD